MRSGAREKAPPAVREGLFYCPSLPRVLFWRTRRGAGVLIRVPRPATRRSSPPPPTHSLPAASVRFSREGSLRQGAEKGARRVDFLPAYGHALHVHAGGDALVAGESGQLFGLLRAQIDRSLQDVARMAQL